MTPSPHRVRARRRESHDIWTLELEPLGEPVAPLPGQFAMLYVHGIGEVPISASGRPGRGERLTHTIRAVGQVTRALCEREQGSVVGVRGPFGTPWPLAETEGLDLVLVAGGIGLAPLRAAALDVLAHRERYGSVNVLVGARTPGDLPFLSELDAWASEPGARVRVTFDAAPAEWRGRVGPVTALIPGAVVDSAAAAALVCGPELMMRFAARALIERGIPRQRIWMSLERNMPCGVGLCGHCQLGPLIICRDGPIFRYDRVEPLLEVREL